MPNIGPQHMQRSGSSSRLRCTAAVAFCRCVLASPRSPNAYSEYVPRTGRIDVLVLIVTTALATVFTKKTTVLLRILGATDQKRSTIITAYHKLWAAHDERTNS